MRYFVPVSSQEPVIQWLSFVYICVTFFFVHFFVLKEGVGFLV